MSKSSGAGRKPIKDLDEWVKNEQTKPAEKKQFIAQYCRDNLPDNYLDEPEGESKLNYHELWRLLLEYRKETTDGTPEDIEESLLQDLKASFLERDRTSLYFAKRKIPKDRIKSFWVKLPKSTVNKIKAFIKEDSDVSNRDQMIYKLVDSYEKRAKDINEIWAREQGEIERRIDLARKNVESDYRVKTAKLEGDKKELEAKLAIQDSISHNREAALFDELDSALTEIARYKQLFDVQEVDISQLATNEKVQGAYVESRLKQVMQRLQVINAGELNTLQDASDVKGDGTECNQRQLASDSGDDFQDNSNSNTAGMKGVLDEVRDKAKQEHEEKLDDESVERNELESVASTRKKSQTIPKGVREAMRDTDKVKSDSTPQAKEEGVMTNSETQGKTEK